MIRLLSLSLISFLLGCKSPIDPNRSISDHFVLIYIGAESRKPLDSTDKNVFVLEASYTYDEFIKRGIPPENIFVLYGKTEPDWTDHAISKEFRKEYSSSYSNEPSVSNLLKIEDFIDDKLSAKSILHIVLNAHGRVDSGGFYMHSEFDNRFVRSEVLNEMLEDNKGLTHLFVGSCYSGQLLAEINEGTGLLVTAASDSGSCWLDRENSFGRIYFSELPADLNSFEYTNSFAPAKKRFIQWGKQRKKFIFEEYKTNRKDELKTIVWDPQFKVLD